MPGIGEIERGRASAGSRRIGEGPVERLCKLACVIALVVMLVVIAVDIVTRSLFNFSFEISDELGGYMLVVITFAACRCARLTTVFIMSSSCRHACRSGAGRSRG